MDVVALEPVTAVQERELDHEGDPHDLAAELLDELDLGVRVPPVASRSSWISTRALGDRVGVELERVRAVFELVLGADGLPGSFPGFRRGDEAAAELEGECAAEDEPARLGARGRGRGLPWTGELREALDRCP